MTTGNNWNTRADAPQIADEVKPTIPRYEIRTGRFGQYFYDMLEGKDVDLPTACELMNAYATQPKPQPTGNEAANHVQGWHTGRSAGEAINDSPKRSNDGSIPSGFATPDSQAAFTRFNQLMQFSDWAKGHMGEHADTVRQLLTAPVPREVMETEFIEACQKSFIFSNVKAIMRLIKREYPDGVKLKGEA